MNLDDATAVMEWSDADADAEKSVVGFISKCRRPRYVAVVGAGPLFRFISLTSRCTKFTPKTLN